MDNQCFYCNDAIEDNIIREFSLSKTSMLKKTFVGIVIRSGFMERKDSITLRRGGINFERKRKSVKSDLNYEGRDEVFLDIDRMINEGLSGGSVHIREDTANIEEARELTEEEPPHHIDG